MVTDRDIPKLTFSEKHSTFSTTFPIYILERKLTKVPVPAPESPVADGDPDELNDDLDGDEQTPKEEQFEEVLEENWVRVNDKAPIWMRWVALSPVITHNHSSPRLGVSPFAC